MGPSKLEIARAHTQSHTTKNRLGFYSAARASQTRKHERRNGEGRKGRDSLFCVYCRPLFGLFVSLVCVHIQIHPPSQSSVIVKRFNISAEGPSAHFTEILTPILFSTIMPALVRALPAPTRLHL
jgi:hypothetical protein